MHCVYNVTNYIPRTSKAHSPLYLGATGGIRLLNITNPEETRLRLLVLKYALQQTGVDVKVVDIISGHDEGMFAWITVNFLKKMLEPQKAVHPVSITYGALDLGGASTQFAFAVNPKTPDLFPNATSLKLFGNQYSIISKSFLCFGMDEAFKRHQALLIEDLNSTAIITDPCLPKGNISSSQAHSLLSGPCTETPTFSKWLQSPGHENKTFTFQGSSDFENCKKSIDNVLNASACQEMGFRECAYNVPIVKTGAFVAFSGFYYVSEFLNTTKVTLNESIKQTADWCRLSWDEIEKHQYKPFVLDHITQYCFGGLYIIQLLTETYGFDHDSWNKIDFQGRIGDLDVGWSLGYMINATNAILEESPTLPVITEVVYGLLLTCSIILVVVGVAFLKSYCRKKDIYSQSVHRRLVES